MGRSRFFALLHNRRGGRALDRQDLPRAAIAYANATTYAPNWSVPWYNLGLVYKLQQRWAESLTANLKAAELEPEDEAAWWNAGIAATALGDWPTARRAWATFGIELPPGDGEIHMALGLVPIRLNPQTHAEVVWCKRIDPARAIIRNIPLPESGHRYGDLLLHDGAPNGTRIANGQEVPVFDALQLLQESAYTTYAVRISRPTETGILALATLADDHDLGIEDWDTIRHLCKACSEGTPEAHEGPAFLPPEQRTTLAIAALSDDQLRGVIQQWAAAHPQSEVSEISVLVPGARKNETTR
jgi:tetratricopeptide (TPR) repeat protein